MDARRVLRRMSVGLALGAALACSQGCTYLKSRGDDAKQMMDLGVTWTKKPHFSVYACLLGLSSLGAGHVDGQFAGVGGGQFGQMHFYNKNLGVLLWTYEELGWDNFDVTKPETLERWHTGPIGWIVYPQRRPSYAPA